MKNIFLASALVVIFTACGGSSPVTTYILNADQQENISKGTNAQCAAADPQDQVTTTNEKNGVLLTLWTESDSTVYAELGNHVYSGKLTGSSYALTDSSSVDDQSAPNRDAIKSDVFSLALTKNGNFLAGTLTHEHHESCGGNNCGAGETQTVDCIYQTALRGEVLPDNGSQAGLPTPGNG